MALSGILRQDTAVNVLIGPFVDSTDGVTAETGLTVQVDVSKNGQALADRNDVTNPTHDAAGTVDGYYNCELDATDTNTVGILTLACSATGALPVRHDYQIVETAVYDALYADGAVGHTSAISDIKSHLVVVAATGAGTLSDITSKNLRILSDVSDVLSHLVAYDAAAGLLSDINSGINVIQTQVANGTLSDITSKLVVIDDFLDTEVATIASNVLIIKSDTSDIQSHITALVGAAGVISNIYSDTTAIEALGGTLTAAQDSKLTVVHGNTINGTLSDITSKNLRILSDVSDVLSHLVAYDAAAGLLSDINSGVNAIQAAGGALTAAQDSKLTVVHGATSVGTLSDVTSKLVVIDDFLDTEVATIASNVLIIKSDTSDIQSHVTKVYSDTTKIETATNNGTLSDITSKLVVIDDFVDTEVATIASNVLIIKSDTSDIQSHVTKVYSDTTKVETATDNGTLSDITSKALRILSDTSDVVSHMVVIDAATSDIQSKATDIEAAVGALNNISVADILGTALADVYAANGAAPTLQQAIMAVHQAIQDFAIAGTSKTVKKLDGTDAFIITHDSATAPTSASRD